MAAEQSQTKSHLMGALSGAIFAVGLAIGGMMQPSKVIRFFDFSEGLSSWDPSLALVMGGGLLVYAPVWALVKRRSRPVLAPVFCLPSKRAIDARLIVGSILFGTGWGLIGYCPGPALAALGTLTPGALVVVGSMLLGMFVAHHLEGLEKNEDGCLAEDA